MAVGMFNSCEEKLPTIQNPGSLYDIDSLVVSADSMDFYRVVREPYIGTSDVLYIGNDENVFAYTLLKFTKINEYLPDAVENFVGFQLLLRSYHQYRSDESDDSPVDIHILNLRNDGLDPWAEDSNSVNNFHLEEYNVDTLTSFTYSDSDTVFIDLDTSLVRSWFDGTNGDRSLVLMQADTSIAAVQAFYSTESSYYPMVKIFYRETGDTVTQSQLILPTEDLSIIRYKQTAESDGVLKINSGRASFGVLTFKFENHLQDENVYVAEANLRLKIDPAWTRCYGETFYLYANLADSAIVGADGSIDSEYDPTSQSYDIYTPVSASADSVVINLESLIQGVTSEYIQNYGIVIYTVPTFSNIATLSIYDGSEQNPAEYRPQLRILTLKEQ